jgi:CheY-like chemotaxis protein
VPARPKVLIVEDDRPLRYYYRSALSLAGFDVFEAGSGYEALRSIDHHTPDIVVLDLGLPGLSGRTVLEELAAQVHTRHIPVVIVTGSIGAEFDQLDAECLLAKPVSSDRLVEVVRNCLASGAGRAER